MKYTLAQRFYFQSIHTVPGEVDSSGEPLVHGHDYSVLIYLKQNQLDNSVWVFSRDQFKAIVQEKLLQFIDKKNLDHWVQPATGERICEKIYQALKESPLGHLISEIQLDETRKNSFNLRIQR